MTYGTRNARQSPSAWMTSALNVLRNEARQHEAFSRGLNAARQEADRILGLGLEGAEFVGYMRAQGGWSKLMQDAFALEVGDAHTPGSEIFGPTYVKNVVSPSELHGIVNDALRARAKS